MEIPLCKNGENIKVTKDNTNKFTKKVAHFYLYKSIKDELASFAQGFWSVVQRDELLEIFRVDELDSVLTGMSEISIIDWKKNTLYKAPYSENHHIIKWYWEIKETFN